MAVSTAQDFTVKYTYFEIAVYRALIGGEFVETRPWSC